MDLMDLMDMMGTVNVSGGWIIDGVSCASTKLRCMSALLHGHVSHNGVITPSPMGPYIMGYK